MTQDPETKDYLIVTKYAEKGDLRRYLKYNPKISWKEKLELLEDIVHDSLWRLNSSEIFHRDLHSGNILISGTGTLLRKTKEYVTDFGLSCPANGTSSDIYGVLPYMAPEVLQGKPCTAKADIYSFGVMMCEMSTCEPPYPDRAHDVTLAVDIIRGLRPKIAEGTPQCYVNLVNLCLDADPRKRPHPKALFMKMRGFHGSSEFLNADKLSKNEKRDVKQHPDELSTSKILIDIINVCSGKMTPDINDSSQSDCKI